MKNQFIDGENQNLLPKEHHEHHEHPKKAHFNFTPIVLMIALSFHALFEGLAVGLGRDSRTVWTLVIAISLHKWAEAMSLGISL